MTRFASAETAMNSTLEPLDPGRLIIGAGINRGAYEQGVLHGFHRLMPSHEGGSAGFSLLPIDTDKFPEQRLDVIGVRSQPQDFHVLRELATAAYEHLPEVERQILTKPALLDEILNEKEAGNSINLVFDHDDSITPAIGLVAVRGALLTFAQKEGRDYDSEPPGTMTVGKGIPLMAAFGVYPAVRLLALGSDVYISSPASSKVVDASDIPKEASKQVNAAINKAHPAARADDPEYPSEHSFCPSGTRTVARKQHEKTTKHWGPASAGTGEWMTLRRNLRIGLSFGATPIVSLPDGLAPALRDSTEVHHFMHEFARQVEESTGEPRKYHNTHESFRAGTA